MNFLGNIPKKRSFKKQCVEERPKEVFGFYGDFSLFALEDPTKMATTKKLRKSLKSQAKLRKNSIKS
jgi:hypothetical protein